MNTIKKSIALIIVTTLLASPVISADLDNYDVDIVKSMIPDNYHGNTIHELRDRRQTIKDHMEIAKKIRDDYRDRRLLSNSPQHKQMLDYKRRAVNKDIAIMRAYKKTLREDYIQGKRNVMGKKCIHKVNGCP